MSGVKISKNQLLSCLIQIYSTFNTREHTRGEGATNHPPAKKRMLLPTDKKKGGGCFFPSNRLYLLCECVVLSPARRVESLERRVQGFGLYLLWHFCSPTLRYHPSLGFFAVFFFCFFCVYSRWTFFVTPIFLSLIKSVKNQQTSPFTHYCVFFNEYRYNTWKNSFIFKIQKKKNRKYCEIIFGFHKRKF